MTKSSTISAQQTPAGDVTLATGDLVIHAQTLTVQTSDRVELVDVTERVSSILRASAVKEGLVSLWSLHTTCALFINENQSALHADIKQFLELTVAKRQVDAQRPRALGLRPQQRRRTSPGHAARAQRRCRSPAANWSSASGSACSRPTRRTSRALHPRSSARCGLVQCGAASHRSASPASTTNSRPVSAFPSTMA